MGSQGVATWIAQLAFWAMLALGFGSRELSGRRAAVFVAIWLTGCLALPRISPSGGLFVTPYVAVLDIVLVFMVFKGDVRLT